MNRYIPDDIIDQIRSRCEITDLIGSYIPLKKAGKNWKALCPFHNEKTPSFTVNPERNSFYCFGCGKGGDIFRFVMEKEGVDFPNAVHLIAEKYHIHIPETPVGGQGNYTQNRQPGQRDRLYKLYELVCAFYQQNLKNPQNPVNHYLQQRQIPVETADAFRLGASPDSWDATIKFCRSQGFTEQELLTADLAKKSEKNPNRLYDAFRNRLMFPIWNEQGKVVAFSGRTLDPDAKGFKYINSGETPVFTKSRILYALPLARQAIHQTEYAILCEGQLDVIAMHRAGFTNAIAPQGTAFTDEQARIIKRYTNRLFLAFDSDAAGIKAIIRAFDIAVPVGLEVRVIQFPDNADPDDIFKQQGAQGLQQVINQAQDFLDFILNQNMQNLDRDSSWDVNRVISDILDHVAKIDSSITRASYCSKIAQRFNIPENAVFNELNKRRKQDSFKGAEAAQPQRASLAPVQKSLATPMNARLVQAEATLLELALTSAAIGQRLANDLPAEMISQTPVGQALDNVIKFTLDGEWDQAANFLHQQMNMNPDTNSELSRIMARENNIGEERQEKAVTDCLRIIKSHYIQIEIEQLKQQFLTATTDDAKNALRQKMQQKSQERREILRS